MTYEFEKCDMKATSIKEEYEDDGYIDDTIVSDATINANDPEPNDYMKYNNITLSETTIVDNIKKEFLFSEIRNNTVNENGQIKEEPCVGDDVKVVLKTERIFCDYCCEEYQDYCTKCGMLEHILTGKTGNGVKDGIPKNILEIQNSLGHFGVFALKIIPSGVKFGPFARLRSAENLWRIKGGKLVVSDGKMQYLNWMKYINSTENASQQNLLVFQHEASLYYLSNREIQIDEELLVHFGEDYEAGLNKDVEVEFNPSIDWEVKNVFACTFCCLGFSSKSFLSQHKTICPYKSGEDFMIEELSQCPSCKIYMEQKEYFEHHITYCDGICVKQAVISPPDGQIAGVKGHSSTTKHHKKRHRVLHKCKLCKYQSTYKTDLEKHINRHYAMKLYKCKMCCRQFKNREVLKVHVMNTHIKFEEVQVEECSLSDYAKACMKSSHLEEVKYNGSKCKYKKSRLKRRIESKHLEDHYRCTACSYRTSYISNLKRHVKAKHVQEKDYECTECDFRTSYKASLETHIKGKHFKDKEYKCTKCEYQTSHIEYLYRHMKAKHVKKQDYRCTECAYGTSYSGNLAKHIKSKHVSEKEYKCAECAYETNFESHLRKHVIAKHVNEKNYICPECEFKTSYKSCLEVHVKSKHLKEGYYECAECEFKAGNKSTLRIHIKGKHLKEKDYQCAECEFKTSYKISLETHIKGKHS